MINFINLEWLAFSSFPSIVKLKAVIYFGAHKTHSRNYIHKILYLFRAFHWYGILQVIYSKGIVLVHECTNANL